MIFLNDYRKGRKYKGKWLCMTENGTNDNGVENLSGDSVIRDNESEIYQVRCVLSYRIVQTDM
jgi:hypothetical protein